MDVKQRTKWGNRGACHFEVAAPVITSFMTGIPSRGIHDLLRSGMEM